MQSVSDKLEKIDFWLAESQKYASREDVYYSGVCYDKAFALAEELLSLHRSEKTFLLSHEREHIESILGIDQDE